MERFSVRASKKLMKENISVYIPAYNAEKTIIFSLNALLKQTFQPSEIIIINDYMC